MSDNAKRRAALVISLLNGETTAAQAARWHGLKGGRALGLARAFSAQGGECAARPPEGRRDLREEHVNRLERKVGELAMDLDIMREAAKLRPTTPGTSAE